MLKFFRRVRRAARFIGLQNVYEGFDTPHWWKTRIGFKTAWKLATIYYE